MLARTPQTLIYLRTAPKPKPRRMNADARKHLLLVVVDILRRGRPTVFAFEAAARHGLRQRLCLRGWNWADADAMAAGIVGEALRRLGAKRPTWLDGQPAAFQDGAQIPRELCLGCGRQLLGEIGERFCSRPCKGAWRVRINAEWIAKTTTAAGEVRE